MHKLIEHAQKKRRTVRRAFPGLKLASKPQLTLLAPLIEIAKILFQSETKMEQHITHIEQAIPDLRHWGAPHIPHTRHIDQNRRT